MMIIANGYVMVILTKAPQHVNKPSGMFRLFLWYKLTVNTVDKKLSSRLLNGEKESVHTNSKHGKHGMAVL